MVKGHRFSLLLHIPPSKVYIPTTIDMPATTWNHHKVNPRSTLLLLAPKVYTPRHNPITSFSLVVNRDLAETIECMYYRLIQENVGSLFFAYSSFHLKFLISILPLYYVTFQCRCKNIFRKIKKKKLAY